jgi:hypothetical protein
MTLVIRNLIKLYSASQHTENICPLTIIIYSKFINFIKHLTVASLLYVQL